MKSYKVTLTDKRNSYRISCIINASTSYAARSIAERAFRGHTAISAEER